MPGQMDEVQLVKVLLDTPLFEDLDYTQVTSIIEACERREVQPGEVLCETRTIDERLLILIDGKLRLESAEGGKLSEMTPVRIIGEMGVFTGQTRSSRVVAEEASTVLDLDAADLEELLDGDPHMGHHMMASLIKLQYSRLHEVNEEMEVLNQQTSRLKQRLEELAPDDPLLAELFEEPSIDIGQ